MFSNDILHRYEAVPCIEISHPVGWQLKKLIDLAFYS